MPEDVADEDPIDTELLARLEAALETLPRFTREVFLAQRVDDRLATAEIAQVTGHQRQGSPDAKWLARSSASSRRWMVDRCDGGNSRFDRHRRPSLICPSSSLCRRGPPALATPPPQHFTPVGIVAAQCAPRPRAARRRSPRDHRRSARPVRPLRRARPARSAAACVRGASPASRACHAAPASPAADCALPSLRRSAARLAASAVASASRRRCERTPRPACATPPFVAASVVATAASNAPASSSMRQRVGAGRNDQLAELALLAALELPGLVGRAPSVRHHSRGVCAWYCPSVDR